MKTEQVKQSLEMDPFRPLIIRTASGNDYNIPDASRVHVHPDGNVVAYFAPNGVVVLIDVGQIVEMIQ